jgi:hypothetical protein
VKRFIGHLRSNAIAYVALFIALGGTAYAAKALPKNSVGTKQLKSNAVTGPKVKNGSLKVIDFKSGQLKPGAKGDKGDTGPQGLQGLQGEKGKQGDKGSPGSGSGVPIVQNSGTPAAQGLPPDAPDVITNRDTAFTTTAEKSTVIVSGFASVDFNCSGGSCTNTGGLYLDDARVPVPGSLVNGATTTQSGAVVNTIGRIADIGPGQHHIALAFKKTGPGTLTTNVVGGSGYLLVIPQP